jgi:hypothetical protein
LAKLWFALSATAFVVLNLTYVHLLGAVLNIFAVFVLALYLEHRYKVLDKLFAVRARKYTLVSLLITAYAVIEIALAFYRAVIKYLLERVLVSENHYALQIRGYFSEAAIRIGACSFVAVLAIMSLFFIFAFVYGVISRHKMLLAFIRQTWSRTDLIERFYFLVALPVFAVFLGVCYSLSPVFWSDFSLPPLQINGTGGGWFYGFDHGNVLGSDAQFYLGQSSVKQLFYQLANFPFALVARALGRIMFFIPFAYVYFLQLFHVSLMLVGGLLIVRMCEVIRGAEKGFFLLLYTFSYSFLVFSLPLEKYVPATFCIILLFYACIYAPRARYIAAVAAAGVLLTNIVALPFVAFDKRLRAWALNCGRCLLGLFVISLFCGSLPAIVQAGNFVAGMLSQNAAGIGNLQKFMQFTNFVSSVFVKPNTEIIYALGDDGLRRGEYVLAWPTQINWFGIIIIALTIIGFVANRKLRFAQYVILWAIFAFVILFVMGWQTTYNEQFLCTFYLGWPFFVLVFLLFEKLLASFKVAKFLIYSAALVAMSIINIAGIADLLAFGMSLR